MAGLGVDVVDGGYGRAFEASAAIEVISGLIRESSLSADLEEQAKVAGVQAQEQVRQVIRDELRPGGMLYRG